MIRDCASSLNLIQRPHIGEEDEHWKINSRITAVMHAVDTPGGVRVIDRLRNFGPDMSSSLSCSDARERSGLQSLSRAGQSTTTSNRSEIGSSCASKPDGVRPFSGRRM